MTTQTITTNERRELINQFNHYATLLHQTDEDSPKWDAIWNDMQSIKAEIDNATVVDENPNSKIDAEITKLKERLNKALVALTNEDRVGSPAWNNHFHNINSLRDDIELLHAQRV